MVDTMPVYADFEIRLSRDDEHLYRVQIRIRRYNDHTISEPPVGRFCYDQVLRNDLLAKRISPEEYGRALGQALLHNTLLDELDKMVAGAEALNKALRLTIQFDRSAHELQALRWETLRHPHTDLPLASDGRILFSRFLTSASGRTARLPARGQSRAIIAVAASSDASTPWGLAPINAKEEFDTARAGLGGMSQTLIGGEHCRTTRHALLSALQQGADLLYLVAHGGLLAPEKFPQLHLPTPHPDKLPCLYLENPDGCTAPVAAQDLVADLVQIPTLPRLAIVVSCRSADPESAASLAWLLGEAGVPTVLAMQGNVQMSTMRIFLPALLASLQRNEPIDAAVAAGRAASLTAGCTDWWMPVLFMRISSGQLWQEGDGFDEFQEVLRNHLVSRQEPGYPELLGSDLTSLARCITGYAGFAEIDREIRSDLANRSGDGFERMLKRIYEPEGNAVEIVREIDKILEKSRIAALKRSLSWLAWLELCKIICVDSLGIDEYARGIYSYVRGKIDIKPAHAPPSLKGDQLLWWICCDLHPYSESLAEFASYLYQKLEHRSALTASLHKWLSINAPVLLSSASNPSDRTGRLITNGDYSVKEAVLIKLDEEEPGQFTVFIWEASRTDHGLTWDRPLLEPTDPISLDRKDRNHLQSLFQRIVEHYGYQPDLTLEVLLPSGAYLFEEFDTIHVAEEPDDELTEPIGTIYPLVVRLQERYKQLPKKSDGQWHARWQHWLTSCVVGTVSDSHFCWMKSPFISNQDLFYKLQANDHAVGLVGFGTFNGAVEWAQIAKVFLKSGVPIALWYRGSSLDEEMKGLLQPILRQDLRSELRQLRKRALNKDNKEYPLGERLTLLWDDPNHIPPKASEFPGLGE